MVIAGKMTMGRPMDRDDVSETTLTPGRIYFVQLTDAVSSLPQRFRARFLSRQLHRAEPGSDRLVRQFTFAICAADDAQGQEIALPEASFRAEPMSVPAGIVIRVDFRKPREKEKPPLIRAVM